MRDAMNSAVFSLTPSAIREFSRLAKETPGCIALTLGEPDFDTPEPVRKSAEEALENHETHYIENSGASALRDRISAFEKEKHGLTYDREEIIVTAGATEAIFTAFLGILEPGDEVVIPTPAFVLYREIVKLLRSVPVMLDTAPDGFQLTEDALRSVITERTKAVIINTPNNPSGVIYTEESLEALRRTVSGKRIFVICDDVYRELCYVPDYHSFSEFTELREQILVVQSFSKPYAMTGWRMGYLMADRSVTERLALVHQYILASTPAPFQKACIAALDHDASEMKATFEKRRSYVLRRLQEMKLPVTEPGGAFYVFPCIREFGMSSGDFARRMIREAGLAVTPGSCFGTEDHIRLTYSYSDEILAEGLDRLEVFIKKLRNE